MGGGGGGGRGGVAPALLPILYSTCMGGNRSCKASRPRNDDLLNMGRSRGGGWGGGGGGGGGGGPDT